ncbi:MAG: hypothetical protein CL840_18315 [Crocinitomicaceae bacterium]|nr:hypothetical protein [Crocinitomicaceae bacterium]
MELSVSVEINKPREEVWKAIVDFENCSNYIESITDLQVLEKPADTLIGFKWKETRVLFGKEATETMWITDYVENEYYQTRAESHGSIYKSWLSIEQVGDKSQLTMSFEGQAQSFFAKVFSVLMGSMMKGSMKKALLKDLNDIKGYLESK